MVAVHGTCDERFGRSRSGSLPASTRGTSGVPRLRDARRAAGRRPVGRERNDAGDPWERDTIVNVYSTTKTMAATVMLMLVDQGQVDIEAPVAEYWPEFKANGKDGVLVRHVLGHTAGVPGFDPAIATETLYDWDACCENLAAQAPWWSPAPSPATTRQLRDISRARSYAGSPVAPSGPTSAQEVAEPLGADFWIGLPASEDDRAADLVPPPETALDNVASDAESIAVRTLTSVLITALEPRTREWRGGDPRRRNWQRPIGRTSALRPGVRR